jgi:acyl carrier protein
MSIDFGRVVVEAIEKNVAGLRIEMSMMEQTLGDLGVDSLDVMLVMMDIQERTGISIPDDKVEELRTPNNIIAFLEAH